LDVTPLVRRDGPNDVLVRVDNTDDPELIPSHRSDFTIYGGLTRDVWLEVVPPVRVSRVDVRTPEVSRDRARATARVVLANPERLRGEYAVDAVLTGPDGRDVRARTRAVALTGDTVAEALLELPAVRAPRLWSPASPTLYRLTVALSRGREETYAWYQHVGFRWFEFRANGPFYLNGERLLLRGTHRHEEHAGYGAAVPNEIHRRDLEMIKAMGANFVRLAHYPQDPEVYRAADSLGLLLWDELPWDRGGLPSSAAWRENTRRLLREQIAQNARHPSIILWSLGNEVADLVEEPNSGRPDSLRAFLGELKAIARELDPSRPTAMRKFDAGADVVDVYSPSIWAGWYRGVYRGYEQAIAEAHAKFPRFFHMEYGADAHFGRHTETPISGEGLRIDAGFEEAVGKPVANIAREGDWSESYQTDLLDWHLSVSERQDWLTGNAQWVFKDFATPLRPENPIPYVNQKGLLTRDGTPKDAYYVFKSYWTASPKFAYIVSHTWTERAGPAGRPRSVRVYSNCATVELTANGASLGVRRRVRDDFPAQGLRWDVAFAQGPNALVARCTGDGERGVADSLAVRYTSQQAGRPQGVRLTSRPLPGGRLLVEATLVDAQGRPSLDASDRIYFDHSGGGRLLADMGTPTGSRAIEAANGRAAIELEPPRRGERAVIVARTQELNGARIIIDGR
ncbi:MAG TPA: glycoside hydrolase family 2 TIM barrel-domain containing protein, partial [Gemmatimonadaceae bacterium]|nr:glycoside hydrolase family 2 TIM barrel-domain containing protein [Gemmatimonadaceae bacterium]